MIEAKDSLSIHNGVIPYEGTLSDYLTYDDVIHIITTHPIPQKKNTTFYNGIEKTQPVETWMIGILLIGYFCLAFSRSVHRKRFSMLFKTLVNWKLSKQIIRYEKVYTHPVNILMTINFVLCFPLFFSLVRSWVVQNGEPIYWTYFFIMIPMLSYFLLKTIIYRFSKWLFNLQDVMEEYVFQTNLFNKYLGLAFLVLTTFLLFAPLNTIFLSYFGLTILALGLAFQIIRGVIIGLEKGVSLFFIIAYLCTLEITPWLLIGKWIKINL